ncbi:MAG: hypothetical protein IJP33_03030 [Firmicutes bacterium]|nr:hypothetical protein [Bacillota bacterium]
MSRFDKISQAAVGIVFILMLFFFGITTAININEKNLSEFSRSAIDEAYNEDFELHDSFIDLNGGFRAALGTDIMRDADPQNVVYKLENGKISTVMAVYDMYENMRNTVAFSNWLEDKGIEFLYVLAPNKNSDPAAIMPAGVHDYADFCMDTFKRIFTEEIPLMDLREEFNAAEMNWDELYFKTDHHWIPRTGFWVSSHLLEYFNEQGTFTTDSFYTDISNYNADLYEGLFLGSLGKRVGKLYAGTDDFEFIYPAFETDFNVTINKVYAQTERSGDFMKAIVYQPLLKMDEDHLRDNHYGAYFGGDYAEVIIRNNKITGGGKLLMIKDSYSLPVAALMSCAVSELRLLDFRYLTEYDLESYIEEYQPDAVIVMYSPSVLGAKYMYKFLNESKK